MTTTRRPAVRQTDIATLFDYLYWVNHRLLDKAAELSNEDFVSGGGGNPTTRNLRATLVHELDVEWSWRLNLQQRNDEGAGELDPASFPDIHALIARWDEDEREMREWLASLTDDDLARDIDSALTRDRRPLWHYLMHIFTHAQQQQADTATLLSQLGHSPGDIGFITWLHQR
jgi:uncharacterized damage-inducible protein DinB